MIDKNKLDWSTTCESEARSVVATLNSELDLPLWSVTDDENDPLSFYAWSDQYGPAKVGQVIAARGGAE